MKRIYRIPTILGLLILITGLGGGIFLIRQGVSWNLRANAGVIPKQVRITNVTESSLTISWVTDNQSSGFVKYSVDKNLNLTTNDDRDQLSGKTGNFLTHHVTLKNLKPKTSYYFKLGSGGKIFDNNGELYQQITASPPNTSPPNNDVAYGTIVSPDGSPVEGAIVYVSLANAAPQSTLTKSSGSWIVPLNMARSSDLSGYLSYDREASIVEIFVQAGTQGTATVVTITKNDSPVPLITLGRNLDFRAQVVPPSDEGKYSPTPTSKFDLQGTITPPASSELTIINPNEGEKINTMKPEVIGTGPPGETLSIALQSLLAFSGTARVDSFGSWKWTPPSDLEPGQHTITVALPNGTQITRSFTVLAAGENSLPSFTATPSGTVTPSVTPTPTVRPPTPTPSPILTPTPTPTPPRRVSRPATEGGYPESGDPLPTFLLFITGSVIMLLGIIIPYFFRKT